MAEVTINLELVKHIESQQRCIACLGTGRRRWGGGGDSCGWCDGTGSVIHTERQHRLRISVR